MLHSCVGALPGANTPTRDTDTCPGAMPTACFDLLVSTFSGAVGARGARGNLMSGGQNRMPMPMHKWSGYQRPYMWTILPQDMRMQPPRPLFAGSALGPPPHPLHRSRPRLPEADLPCAAPSDFSVAHMRRKMKTDERPWLPCIMRSWPASNEPAGLTGSRKRTLAPLRERMAFQPTETRWPVTSTGP